MNRLAITIATFLLVGFLADAGAQTASHLRSAISVASTVVSQGGPGGPGGPGRGGRFRGPTDEEKEKARIRIGLSKEQQAEIDKVFKDSDQQMTEVRTRFGELSRQLYTLYNSYDFDRQQAQQIRRELLKLHSKMADIHADNEEKLRKIMTREQFDRMRALMKEAWENMRKERGDRRPPGGGPPAWP